MAHDAEITGRNPRKPVSMNAVAHLTAMMAIKGIDQTRAEVLELLCTEYAAEVRRALSRHSGRAELIVMPVPEKRRRRGALTPTTPGETKRIEQIAIGPQRGAYLVQGFDASRRS